MLSPHDDDLLAEYAAAGIGMQTSHDSVFGGGLHWISRDEARRAVAAAARLAGRRPRGPDAVGPRAWELAAGLVHAWLALPDAGAAQPPDPADLRVLSRAAAALAAELPAPGPPVSPVRCPPGPFAPDERAYGDPRFPLDGTIAALCDVLRDPGWADPHAVAGIVDDCRGWLRLYRRRLRLGENPVEDGPGGGGGVRSIEAVARRRGRAGGAAGAPRA